MFLGFLHCLDDYLRSGFRQGGKNASRVQPSNSFFTEDIIPVDLAGFHSGGCSVAAVRGSRRTPYAEATLCKVKTVANLSAYAVEGLPSDQIRIDSSLEDEVFDQSAHVVVGECGCHCRA